MYYNLHMMKTWDYEEQEFEKQAKADEKWYLERLINYDLAEKLDRTLVEKYLPELRIDENRRAFLELLIWNKKF